VGDLPKRISELEEIFNKDKLFWAYLQSSGSLPLTDQRLPQRQLKVFKDLMGAFCS
jgi:hypothetical protein